MCFDVNQNFLQVHSLIPRLWTANEISSEAELDLLFSEVHYRPAKKILTSLITQSKPTLTDCTTCIIPDDSQHTKLLLQLRPAAVLVAKETQQTLDGADCGG